MNLKLIWKFWMINVRQNLEYPLNALIGTIAIGLTNVSAVVFFFVIFAKIPALSGWTLGQVLFLSGTVSVAAGLQHAFLSGASGWSIEYMVQQGEFDRILLRPLGKIPHMLMNGCFDIDGLGDFIAGLIIVIFASGMIGISWSLYSLLLYSLFVFSGTLIITAMHALLGTIAFWTTRVSSIFDLYYTMMRFAEYPLDIFSLFMRLILTVVFPIAFISYYPSQVFVNNGIWMKAAYLTPLVAIIMLIIAKKAFDYGVSKYTSTGS